MKIHEFFRVYANMPLGRRYQLISVKDLGLVSWYTVWKELSDNTKAGEKMLKIINEEGLDELMKRK